MTDAEIIKALLCDMDHVFCSECAYKGIMGCRLQVRRDARDLILRLIDEKEQVRKDTAKEILKAIHSQTISQSLADNHVTASTNMVLLPFRRIVEREAIKYGVEVDE